jgi:hypothetical protein
MIHLVCIGDYKTGTSWWQKKVLPEHPELYYLDSSYHRDVINLMHQLVDLRDLDFNAESLRLKFDEVLNGLDLENKKLVISREALSGKYPTGDHAKRIAERLYAVFGPTKILIVIREQFSMLKAIYSEYIKMGGTLTFNEFIYDPVASPGLIEKLKYDKIINVYVELFGRENVFIGLFEEFKSDNESFVAQVMSFIGCSTSWHLPASPRPKVNASLTRAGVEVQRFINGFLRNDFNPRKPLIPIDKLVALFLSKQTKQKLLDGTRNRLVYSIKNQDETFLLRYAINFTLTLYVSKICENIQVGPKLSVPDNIVDNFKREFVVSNRVLKDKYGLSVEKYDWSL